MDCQSKQSMEKLFAFLQTSPKELSLGKSKINSLEKFQSDSVCLKRDSSDFQHSLKLSHILLSLGAKELMQWLLLTMMMEVKHFLKCADYSMSASRITCAHYLKSLTKSDSHSKIRSLKYSLRQLATKMPAEN